VRGAFFFVVAAGFLVDSSPTMVNNAGEGTRDDGADGAPHAVGMSGGFVVPIIIGPSIGPPNKPIGPPTDELVPRAKGDAGSTR
jgi:hypothetical protein